MVQKLDLLKESPSQTAGPYVHIGCTPNFAEIAGVWDSDLGTAMRTGPVAGEAIVVTGAVHDSAGMVLRVAMVEVWQADAAGRFAGQDGADPNFTGWGRSLCDMETGRFRFKTVKPGRIPWPNGRMQAPHLTFRIVARGINIGLHTRMYFEDDPALGEDPIWTRIEHRHRVPTLLARLGEDGDWHFDIHLQGPRKTIFFDV